MPATDTRHRTTWGTRFRLFVRAVGLTGVLAVVVGAALFASAFPSPAQWTPDTARAAAEGGSGDFAKAAVWTLAGGAVAVALALVVEVLGALFLVAGRRTAANTSATIGTLAAVALLFFVNAYSYTHHARIDLTRDQKYTLPADLADRLRTLRPESPTTIVVLQNHNLFGTLSDRRDSFTKAAEEKVTEKVKDLVDLFREFGPRFNVAVLDTEAYGYDRQLADLTRGAPELKAAIEAAPENSILFHANGRVQRLAFNEFLQLDKTASKAADDGRGNLVLLPQGVENFARRVLAVEERRPKAAVCVVHEWLSTATTAGQSQYSVGGLRRALEDQGYDVVDIILKKNWEDASRDLEPAAYTVTESRLERLEAELDSARAQAAAAQRDLALIGAQLRVLAAPPLDNPPVLFADLAKSALFGPWRGAAGALGESALALDRPPAGTLQSRVDGYNNLLELARIRGWAEVVRSFLQWRGGDVPITPENEPGLRRALLVGLARQAGRAGREVEDAVRARAEADEAVRVASRDERMLEARRQSDVKGKFASLLKDVDLLIVPRFTLVNPTIGQRVDPELHTLSKAQVDVIRDFMKQGKPVMACLGSLSGPNGFDRTGVDDLDRLVSERGIELGRDTVLYDAEAKAFAAIVTGRQLGGGTADIPPLSVVAAGPDAGRAKPNPVGAAFALTGRSVDQKLDLRLPATRPVYLAEGMQDHLTYAAEFVFTGKDSWNEERPFITRSGRSITPPRYDPPIDVDANTGSRATERRGPFPVGVAIEGKVPASWYAEAYDRQAFAAATLPIGTGVADAGLAAYAANLDRPTQRLVVFGSGNLFSGQRLEPAQEKLLVHAANWLTGRTDRLPRADQPAWSFPRVLMGEREFYLWRYGTAVGLPLAAVYLGLMVTMVRRTR